MTRRFAVGHKAKDGCQLGVARPWGLPRNGAAAGGLWMNTQKLNNSHFDHCSERWLNQWIILQSGMRLMVSLFLMSLKKVTSTELLSYLTFPITDWIAVTYSQTTVAQSAPSPHPKVQIWLAVPALAGLANCNLRTRHNPVWDNLRWFDDLWVAQ